MIRLLMAYSPLTIRPLVSNAVGDVADEGYLQHYNDGDADGEFAMTAR